MSTINVYPRSTEKAYGLSKNNIYVFEAPVNMNSKQIQNAVELQYDVKVEAVNTLIQKGKAIRAHRGKKYRPGIAVRSDIKKAYVTLVEGDSINIFDEQNEATKPGKDKEKK